ncbi:hypothetical protein NDU88_002633 [Pleurodeles waltl]|uniref:Uncharacterized protein n=1 Tax=Pleurodeles waltl TaxID=8319 RepID=A0AAV7VDU8_PLEWA|nr:hypothetical protein NDU88_002633 [Pleurodeles waltl]
MDGLPATSAPSSFERALLSAPEAPVGPCLSKITGMTYIIPRPLAAPCLGAVMMMSYHVYYDMGIFGDNDDLPYGNVQCYWGVSRDGRCAREGVRRSRAGTQSWRHRAFRPRLARTVRGEERGDEGIVVRPSGRESPGRPGGAIGGARSDPADRVRERSSAETWGPLIGTSLAGFAFRARVAIAGPGAGGGALI